MRNIVAYNVNTEKIGPEGKEKREEILGQRAEFDLYPNPKA